MPLGFHLRTSSLEMSQGRISQYTPSSRTRRAISWVYCAPKSRIRTREEWMSVWGVTIAAACSCLPQNFLAPPRLRFSRRLRTHDS